MREVFDPLDDFPVSALEHVRDVSANILQNHLFSEQRLNAIIAGGMVGFDLSMEAA